MKNGRWLRWDRLMRALHLYTGMFLVPWMVVYAVSAFCLNHYNWFFEKLQPQQKWEVIGETDFTADAALSSDQDEQAKALLRAVDLEGAYRIQPASDANQLIVFRPCIAGHYQVTWQRPRSHVVVERLKYVSFFYSFVNNLHFQSRYDQPYFAFVTWAALVDAVTTSTVVWVISGIYLWARRPRKRLLGGVCMTAGIVLFGVLVALLCQ